MTLTSCPVGGASTAPQFPGSFDPDVIAGPLPYLTHLQREAPVFFDDTIGMWLVSRHADVRAVLSDPDTYRPDNALDAVVPLTAASLRVLVAAGFTLPHTLANNGGPSHRAYRREITAFFSPARIAAAESTIRALVDEAVTRIVQEAQSDATVNLVPLLADAVPPRVLIAMLGLDDVVIPELKAWSRDALELFWGNPSRERQLHLATSAAEFYRWLRRQIRRTDLPDGSLFAMLAGLRDADGDPAPETDGIAIAFFLLVAGQETTSQLVATTLHRLVGDRELWHSLSAARGDARAQLAAAAVEEVLRLDSPVATWRRVTRRPVRLHGVDLPAGASLLLMLTATGSDAEVYPDAERLVPGRPRGGDHHAFGYGRHFCVGAGLARLEARLVVEIVAERLPHLTLVEDRPPQLGLLSFRAPLRVLTTTAAAVEVGVTFGPKF